MRCPALEEGSPAQPTTAASILSSTSVVQLRYATLPNILRTVAVHYWFAVFDPSSQQWHRWEVWQTTDAGGQSNGHVHCDLRHPDCGVGGGAYRLAAEWSGNTAQAICAVLYKAQDYPHRDHYRAWPGPNSNTFVAWVLRQAGVHHVLDPRAIGKDYLGRLGIGLSLALTGVQVETPVFGVKLGLHNGVEVHLLGFTGGVQWWPPAVYTPFGRVSLLKTPAPSQPPRPANTDPVARAGD